MTNRMKRLIRAAEILLPQDEREAELDKLVAAAMQAGYELGKLSAEKDEAQD